MHVQSRESHLVSDQKRMAGVPFSGARSSPSSQGGVSGLEPTNKKEGEAQPPPSCCSLRGRPVAGAVFPFCGINPTPRNNRPSLFNFTLSLQSPFTSLFIHPPSSQMGRTGFGFTAQLPQSKKRANIIGSFSPLLHIFNVNIF